MDESVGGGKVPDTLIRRTYGIQEGKLVSKEQVKGVLHHEQTLPAREEWGNGNSTNGVVLNMEKDCLKYPMYGLPKDNPV